MAKTLEQILGFETLTRTITDPAGGVPTIDLPAGFFTLTTPVAGRNSSYKKVRSTRAVSQLTDYDGSSKEVDTPAEGETLVTLLHSKESIRHQAVLLQQLTGAQNPARQQKAIETVARRTAEFRRRFQNHRLASVYSMLGLGHIYYNASGQLLNSNTGNAVDVNFQPTTGNAGVGAWNTSSTDIAGQIEELEQTMEQDNGLLPVHVLYGKNVPYYLSTNDSVKNLLNGVPSFAEAFLRNGLPDGLLGKTWWPGRRMWFEDESGSKKEFFGDNSIALFPEPTFDWYELQEGSYIVPTDIAVSSDAAEAAANIAEVNGMFSYAVIKDDPVSIKQVMGDTWLPVCKVPGAIRIVSDVTQAAA